jgi:hypothetical protein
MKRVRRPLVALVAPVVLCAGLGACGDGATPTFNPLPSRTPAATTAPSAAPSRSAAPSHSSAPTQGTPPPENRGAPIHGPGGSSLQISGELSVAVTSGFDCNTAKDDHFVRGYFDLGDGPQLAISINVEHYTGPGRYDQRAQVLIRRLRGTTFYASWYSATATATVRSANRSTDLDRTELPPEAGTASTMPMTVQGHLACNDGAA